MVGLAEERLAGFHKLTSTRRRAVFWREQIQTDPALAAVRKGPAYTRLAATYGHGPARVKFLEKDPRGFADFHAAIGAALYAVTKLWLI